MKANELRIGNLIHNPIQKIDLRVTVDLLSRINYDYFNTQMNPKDKFQPIPLTEEWLLKFGFIKGDYNWFRLYFNSEKLDDSDCFTYNINSKMLCLESFYDGKKKGSVQLLSFSEKHVHTLQNLYFALTNEELKTTL